MSVAALDGPAGEVEEEKKGSNEALMILGIEGPAVGKEVESELRAQGGILDVSVVRL